MTSPVIISLPIADRRASHGFYRGFLGLESPGEAADDGIPEPLQFHVNAGLTLMLIPSGGFGWVIDTAAETAGRGSVSALLTIQASTTAQVDDLTRRVPAAGGTVARAARQEPWGYCSLVADPDGHLWQVSSEQ